MRTGVIQSHRGKNADKRERSVVSQWHSCAMLLLFFGVAAVLDPSPSPEPSFPPAGKGGEGGRGEGVLRGCRGTAPVLADATGGGGVPMNSRAACRAAILPSRPRGRAAVHMPAS